MVTLGSLAEQVWSCQVILAHEAHGSEVLDSIHRFTDRLAAGPSRIITNALPLSARRVVNNTMFTAAAIPAVPIIDLNIVFTLPCPSSPVRHQSLLPRSSRTCQRIIRSSRSFKRSRSMGSPADVTSYRHSTVQTPRSRAVRRRCISRGDLGYYRRSRPRRLDSQYNVEVQGEQTQNERCTENQVVTSRPSRRAL